MLKELGKNIGKYNKLAILTPLLVVCEVAIEVSIPFVISKLIDVGIEGDGGVSYVVKMGLIMLAMAFASLCFGGLAGRTSAVAGVGFAKNLRNGLFSKVQDYSFANITQMPLNRDKHRNQLKKCGNY